MAKRIRDYKAEERRRNELARQRGFTSRAQERGHKFRQRELEAREWSAIHAFSKALKYDPEHNNPHHLSRAAYLRAYERGVTHNQQRIAADGRMFPLASDPYEYWLTDVTDTMTDDEYEQRY